MGDGSLERVLIGQLVSPGAEEDSGKWSGTPPAEMGSPPQAVQAVLGSLRGRSSTYPESREHVGEHWLAEPLLAVSYVATALTHSDLQ